jgi:hypothetical protein
MTRQGVASSTIQTDPGVVEAPGMGTNGTAHTNASRNTLSQNAIEKGLNTRPLVLSGLCSMSLVNLFRKSGELNMGSLTFSACRTPAGACIFSDVRLP